MHERKRRMMILRWTTGVIIGAAAVLLLGCETPTDADDDSIAIAVVGPHSGSLDEYGIPTLRAATLIVEEVNGDGGLLGRTVEIVALDDECTADLADDRARDALDAGVVGVIGHVCSGATEAALSVYEDTALPVIAPSTTDPTLTTTGSPFFFRTIAADSAITEAMLEILESESATDIYLLYDSEASYWDAAAIARVETQISASSTRTGTSGIDFSDSGVIGTAATTIAGSGANGVMILPAAGGGEGATVAAIVDDLRDAGYTGPIAASNDAYESALITNLTDSSDVFVVGDLDVADTTEATELKAVHDTEYGEASGAFFINGAAALEVLIQAIEEVGSTDASELVAAIEGGTFSTVLGEIEFTNGEPSGDRIGYGKYEISGSAFVVYTP